MTTLYLDLETYSDLDLKEVGAHVYAQQSEIILMIYAIDNETPRVIEFPTAEDLGHLFWGNDFDEYVIHNSTFDRTILTAHDIHVPVEKVTDTMILAMPYHYVPLYQR